MKDEKLTWFQGFNQDGLVILFIGVVSVVGGAVACVLSYSGFI